MTAEAVQRSAVAGSKCASGFPSLDIENGPPAGRSISWAARQLEDWKPGQFGRGACIVEAGRKQLLVIIISLRRRTPRIDVTRR